jgi:ribose transport system ATP-binding protein
MTIRNVLAAKSISKSFPGVKALDNVDFTLRRGEVHALVGENGAGKSTLIKILSGVYPKDKDGGKILLDEREVSFSTPKDAFWAGISVIHQEFNLFPHLDVGTNILVHRLPLVHNKFGKWIGLIEWKTVYKEAKRLLESMEVDVSPFDPVENLSASRKKIVEIVRALSADSRIILMDEPTASLTSEEQRELFHKIRRLREKGVSIIYISHRLEEIVEIADRITVLREGKVVRTLNNQDTHVDEIIRLMIGEVIKNRYPKETADIREVVFEVKGLSREKVLKDVSFCVKRGEILGIAGIVGAGKTELARAVFGADRIRDGKLLLRGKEVRVRSPKEAVSNGLAYITEDRKKEGLVMVLPVKENFILPSINSNRISKEFLSRLRLLRFPAIRRRCEEYVKKLNIRCSSVEQKAAFLSGGNQQKVVIAKWLNTRAEVFLFDEPTVGIDIASKVEIYREMEQ